MRLLQAGKIQALVTGHAAVHEPRLRRLALLVNYDFPASLDSYLASVSRAGPAASSATVLSLLSISEAGLAAPLADLLQVCAVLLAALCCEGTAL